MDKSHNRNLRVGIFLAVGIFTLMASIMLLGGDKAFLAKHVTLLAKLDQVQGLDRGSVVSLAGVVIGNVATIKFSPEKKSLMVEMKIQEEFLPMLTENAHADVRTQGALGDKYIYIAPGDPTAPGLKDGDTIQTTKSSDILGMLAEKSGEAAKIFDIIDEVYKLTHIINADGRSERIISNFVDASENMKAMSEDGKKLMSDIRGGSSQHLKQSIEHLNSVLTKIDRGDGSLGALINDPTLHERLKVILGADTHKQSIQSLIRTSIQKGGN